MENKINVAELLRKCPEGMELDCTLFSKPLKYSGFEGFQDAYPIKTVAENGEIIWFTKEGCIHNNMYSKCVIFPKGKTTWEGFIPPCTFKKGDVLISQAGNMVLFSHINFENLVYYHCIIPTHGSFRIAKNPSAGVGEYHRCILANEHQKQRMYDAIKSAGYKYNQDTNKLEKIHEFKDGDICYIKTKDINKDHIFIFNGIDERGYIKRYVNLTSEGLFRDNMGCVCNESAIKEFRYATEEEKDRLFKSIKDHGYMWNTEKKCLEKLPRFKNGDVVATNSGTWIGIVENQESDIAMTTHCVLKDTGDFEAYLEEKGRWCFSRLATEDEKQRLFKVIEDNGYKWDAERKCLIKAPKFKNGDVIVGKESTGSYIAIVKEFTNSNSFTTHMFLTSFGTNIAGLNDSNPRLATEYEKQQLFKILKAKGRKWNPETKTLEELPKFKDGDIVAAPIIATGGVWIGIFKQYEDTTFEAYCSLSSMGRFSFIPSRGHILKGTHLATEEEKEKFFKVIKDFGYKWNAETKTLEKIIKTKFSVGDKIRNKLTLSCFIIEEIKDNYYYIKRIKNNSCCFIVPFNQEKNFELIPDKFDINTLKPFEQVLVRDTINDKWHIQFFEKFDKTQHFPFMCVLSEYKQCVPYKGNEHLHDTRDECSDYYKTWE